MMINEYIADVCDLLDIDVPIVSFNNTHFPTETTMALCDPATHTIYLRKVDNPNPDYVFSIAHELRHIYQYETDKQYYLSAYKAADKCSSIKNIICKLQKSMLTPLLLLDERFLCISTSMARSYRECNSCNK